MTGQEYPGRRRTESAAFGWERRRFGAGEDSPGAWAETPPADPAGRKRGERAPFGALNVGGTTKCENLHALVPLICGGTGACCCFLGGGAPLPPSPGGGIFGIGQCRGFLWGVTRPGRGPRFWQSLPRVCFAAPAASPFLCGQKGAKKPLRTCGSKDSLFALTCTGGLVLLAGQALLSAGGRYGCPRVRALSALPWWVDELPTNPHRTTNTKPSQGQ